MHNKTILKLYLIAVAIKISLGVFAILFSNIGIYNASDDQLLLENLTFENFFGIYHCADSGWYRVIAENGYFDIPETETSGWSRPNLHFAFFPLFPLILKMIMTIFGTSFHASAFIFNILILYPMVRYFYLFLFQCKIAEMQAVRIALLLLFFPFSLHFYFIYTESLYFTLLMACLLFISKRQWLQFAIAGGLVVLTRPNGLVLAIPLLLYMLERDGKLNLNGIKSALKAPYYYLLLIMPVIFGFWLLYQHSVTGNWLAFAEAQSGWKKQFMFPLMAFFRNGFWQEQFTSIYCIAIILIAIYWYKRWSAGFNALVWIGILLPLSAGSVISMTRYISVLFPFHIQFGLLKFTNNYFKWIVILFIVLQLFCLKLWIEDNSLMF